MSLSTVKPTKARARLAARQKDYDDTVKKLNAKQRPGYKKPGSSHK